MEKDKNSKTIPIIDVDITDYEIDDHLIFKEVPANKSLEYIIEKVNEKGYDVIDKTRCNVFVTDQTDNKNKTTFVGGFYQIKK